MLRNNQNSVLALLVFVVSCYPTLVFGGADTKIATLVVRNANIYTVDVKRSWAEAVAVRNGVIQYVGNNKGVNKYIGENTRVIDMGGALLLPGFIDSHVHPLWGGMQARQLNLKAAKTVEEVQALIVEYRKRNPNIKSISGGNWIAANFVADGPKKEWLDQVVDDIPVLLVDHFGHTGWANSKAIELAGINGDTPDPAGGQIEKAANSNEPTGIFKEPPAFALFKGLFPKKRKSDDAESLKKALEYLNENGFTSFINAYTRDMPLGQSFIELAKKNELTLRTTLSFKIEQHVSPKDIQYLVERRNYINQSAPQLLNAHIAKVFLDGVILSDTAAMLAPYEPPFAGNSYKGYLFTDRELISLVQQLDHHGFELHFHTVGDGAAHQALNAVASLKKLEPSIKRVRTPMISHLTVVKPEDVKRFKDLGVFVNAQMFWSKHHEIISKVEERLGKARSETLYNYGSLLKAGANFVGGSDWPVSTANPFFAMQIAMTRPYTSLGIDVEEMFAQSGASERVWLPNERVTSLGKLIDAFTINGAKVMKMDDMIGSIEVGKRADMISVDRNIFKTPIKQLWKTKVDLLIFDGEMLFDKRL